MLEARRIAEDLTDLEFLSAVGQIVALLKCSCTRPTQPSSFLSIVELQCAYHSLRMDFALHLQCMLSVYALYTLSWLLHMQWAMYDVYDFWPGQWQCLNSNPKRNLRYSLPQYSLQFWVPKRFTHGKLCTGIPFSRTLYLGHHHTHMCMWMRKGLKILKKLIASCCALVVRSALTFSGADIPALICSRWNGTR